MDFFLMQRGERMSEEEVKVMLDDACPCKDGRLDYAEVMKGWWRGRGRGMKLTHSYRFTNCLSYCDHGYFDFDNS